MKTIAVIVLNDPNMISQEDFISYQKPDCYFKVYYTDKTKAEYNTPEDVVGLPELLKKKALEAQNDGVRAIICFSFGGDIVDMARKALHIPILTLGAVSLHIANIIHHNHYSVILGSTMHNMFLKELISTNHVEEGFVPITTDLGLSAGQIKTEPKLFEKMFAAACYEIENNNVDTFVLGCGFFIGKSRALEDQLRKKYNRYITVVDLVGVTCSVAEAL